MSNMRPILFIGLIFVSVLLWQAWQKDYGPRPVQEPAVQSQSDSQGFTDVDGGDADLPSVGTPVDQMDAADDPDLPEVGVPVSTQSATTAVSQDDLISVRTDVYDLKISPRGGSLVHAELLAYPIDRDAPAEKFVLLGNQRPHYYVASSGLVSGSHQNVLPTTPFSADRRQYTLNEGQDSLEVPLTWTGADGITVTKTYRFSRGSYQIGFDQTVRNNSSSTWEGRAFHRLDRTEPNLEDSNAFTNPERFSFNGAAIYTDAEKYEKFDYDDLRDGDKTRNDDHGWMAMVQHYFITAWLPEPGVEMNYIAKTTQSNQGMLYRLQSAMPTLSVAPGTSQSFTQDLFMGPKLQDVIDSIRPGFDLTVDYGIFTPLSAVLFWILDFIHGLIGNWGWAIVILTILIKGLFFKLTEKQYKTTAKLRKLGPRIQALKERYSDDKKTFNMKMMELYKTEKANPFGGCLPMLVQIPVFIALYWVLIESVELRQAPWMLWIQDLTAPDPYFILPLIYGAGMIMTMRLSPSPGMDPMQQKIMMFMPVAFTLLFLFFQSGLVLYWAVNVMISLAQQWVITKRIDAQA